MYVSHIHSESSSCWPYCLGNMLLTTTGTTALCGPAMQTTMWCVGATEATECYVGLCTATDTMECYSSYIVLARRYCSEYFLL